MNDADGYFCERVAATYDENDTAHLEPRSRFVCNVPDLPGQAVSTVTGR